jgi:hypothetical protein
MITTLFICFLCFLAISIISKIKTDDIIPFELGFFYFLFWFVSLMYGLVILITILLLYAP